MGEESDRARDLYKRLLDRTQHVKVWLSFAQFKLQVDHDDKLIQARHVYEEANKALRQAREKEERLMLLEAWRDFESSEGTEATQKQVADLMPRRVKKRRKVETDGGSDQGWEEYFDYIFPEDEAAKPNLKLLAMAKMWKKNKDVEPESVDSNDSANTDQERVPETEDNLDADDADIRNESSSDSDDDSTDEPNPDSKSRRKSESCSDEEDSKRQRVE